MRIAQGAKSRRLSRLATISLTAAAAATLPIRSAGAASQWVGGTSNWNTAANWNPSGVPGAGATANATGTTMTSQTITYNYNGTGQTLGTLTVNLTGGTGGASEILLMNAGDPLAAVTESVGGFVGTPSGGNGTINQSTGQNGVGAGFLVLGYNATDQGTYILSGDGSLTCASSEIVGNDGTGLFNQSAGANTLSNTSSLYVGDNAGATGTYILSGGSLSPSGFEAIGNSGNGLFNQSGGTNTLGSNQSLFIASNAASTGSYVLSAGSLSVSANELIGNSGAATFNQNGGTNTLTGAASYISLASNAAGSGVYNLSGGVATAVNMYVGGSSSAAGGKGILTVSGSGELNLNSTGTLTVYNTSGSGLTLAGGTINTGSINLSGNLNNFNFSSGTLTLLNSNFTTVIDPNGNLASSLTIGANQVLAMAGNEQIAASGTATLTQTGGANVVENAISIAAGGGGNGTYNLSGGGATANGLYVGVGGPGLVNQTGGTYAGTGPGNFISDGPNAGQTGTYILSGSGSVTTLQEAIGAFGDGIFNQSGGTNTVTQGGNFWLGLNGGSTGTFILSGTGALSAPTEYVGDSGNGFFNQSGGTNTVGTSIYIANNGGTSGTYTLSGSGALVVGSTEFVGFSGAGTFTQTGGTNTDTAGAISIGAQPGSTGLYVLSGTGSVSMATEYVGAFGSGTFIQSAGANTISGPLFVAANGGSTGTYILSGSGSLSDNGFESIGNEGLGLFNQSGGVNSIINGNQLYLSYYGGSTSTYALSGSGSLLVSGSENIASSGIAIFNQTGGVNTITGGNDLYIANSTGGTGTYLLTGGMADISGSVYVSSPGAVGILTVGGSGVLNVGGTLSIVSSVSSVINLSGGTINVAALDLNGIPSLLNWTGGTLDLTSNVTFDSDAADTTTSDAFLNQLTLGANENLTITGNETLGGTGAFSLTLNNGSSHYVSGTLTISPTGTITQNSGSTLYAADIILAGGNVNGTLTNQGVFQYQSGSLTGRLLNQVGGTVNFGASFTAGNGIENDNELSIHSGQTLTVNGAGLDNLGTFNMSGGTLAGAGPALNDITGILNAAGTINNSTFTNEGVLDLQGVLRLNGTSNTNSGILDGSGTIEGAFSNAAGGNIEVAANDILGISNAWTNSGLISPLGGLLSGGAITNAGTIEGNGEIDSPISNTTGAIRASGGELILGGSGGTNSASGQIQSAASTEILYAQGLSSSAGDIAITGGAFDNNNHVLTNTGYISGWGTFRSGGLTNNASMDAGGLDVFGGVVNGATGAINATGAILNAFFGPVTNNSGGSFTVQGGASVTFFNSYTGSSPVSNSGTVTFAAIGSSGPITGPGKIIVGDGAASSLQLTPNGGTSSQASLVINNGSTVDVTNNSFLVKFGAGADPVSAISSYLAGGYNAGAWNGAGIDSSTVASLNSSQSALIYSIGYADGSDGITGVPSGEIEILPTLAGDAKMQGNVVFGDFQLLSQYFGQANTTWDEGDFTYNGTTNFGDFQLLSQNFGQSAGGLTSGEIASINGFAAQFGEEYVPDGTGYSLVSVPEPASVGLLVAAGLGLMSRRRRKMN